MSKEHDSRQTTVSDYLASIDVINSEGQTIKAIITGGIVDIRRINGVKKPWTIVFFTDPKLKPMTINTFNRNIMKKFTGTFEADEWKNIPVEIYVDHKVKFGDEIVDGLRIKSKQPFQEKPELLQTLPAWPNIVAFYKTAQSFEKIEAQYKVSDEVKSLIKLQANG